MRSRFIPLILISGLLAISALFGAAYFNKQTTIPSIAPSPTSMQTTTQTVHNNYWETYSTELTQEQFNKFITTIPKISRTDQLNFYNTASFDKQKWSYWDSQYSPTQNYQYLIRTNNVCQIVTAWCGSALPEQVAKECSNFTVDQSEEWIKSNSGQCCRAYKTNRPYRFGCADTTTPAKGDSASNKELTNQVLREGGIMCEKEGCLSPVKDTVFVY